MTFPSAILSQHIGAIGKTGSGKTSTVKLIVEQLLREDANARVCILDPIKSDHWGLTRNAAGKGSGLPFSVLGGPFGHVILNSSAGDAIGRVVASGALPLSILDMADFEMGGHAKFFCDFAHALFRNVRGVLHLVVEEAHIFAPKEKAGFGEENKSTYWMKRIATGARSKGIRLVVATQRTQELHNAVLGSCETMIVHRITSPADQEPVAKWLKANMAKDEAAAVMSSFSSLKTGEGWMCSGEAQICERRQFPRIKTYDNSATPTGNSQDDVRPAPVDTESLRSIIGAAVEDAKANDPAELKKEIAQLKRQLAEKPAPVKAEPVVKEVHVINPDHLRELGSIADRYSGIARAYQDAAAQMAQSETTIRAALLFYQTQRDAKRNEPVTRSHIVPPVIHASPEPAEVVTHGLSKRQQKFLDAAAALQTLKISPNRENVCGWIGVHPRGGSVGEELKALTDAGFITLDRGNITVTSEGLSRANAVDPTKAIEQAKKGLTPRQSEFFALIVAQYPGGITREQIAEAKGIHPRGGSLGEDLGRLVGRGLVEGHRGTYKARAFLFGEVE